MYTEILHASGRTIMRRAYKNIMVTNKVYHHKAVIHLYFN